MHHPSYVCSMSRLYRLVIQSGQISAQQGLSLEAVQNQQP